MAENIMTPDEQNLQQQLRRDGATKGTGEFLNRTKCEFVLEYGYWYDPIPSPDAMAMGKPNECFKNAFDLAMDSTDFIYCEGFALYEGGLRVHHAWVTDGQGRAIDNTWGKPGVAYAGVPFLTDFLNLRFLLNEAVICQLDDWEHDWPLLRDLGDRPDEWFEFRGKGMRRLARAGVQQKKR